MNKVVMKKILVALGVVVSSFVALWGYGNYVRLEGAREAAWILDMWGVKYFGHRSSSSDDFEIFYYKSLAAGAKSNQELIDFVVKGKCYDSSWRCSVIMTAASNIMLDNGQSKVGLRGAVEAYERLEKKCPIVLETTIVSYQLRELSMASQSGVEKKASALLQKIKVDGGVLHDMRNETCRQMAIEKPEYFTTYALLVAKLMTFSGGADAYSAAYLDSLER
jgi:hypothetical protein